MHHTALDPEMVLLDYLEQPVFAVRDGRICYQNKAARSLALEDDSLSAVLGGSLEFYRQYDGRTGAHLSLQFGAQERSAVVIRRQDTDIFIVSAKPSKPSLSLDSLMVLSQSMRGPLASAFGVTSALFPVLEEQEDPMVQTQTAALNKSLYQLLRLAGNLTDMSRLLAGEMPMYEEKTELTGFIGSLCDKARPLCEAIGIELKYACPNTKIHAVADRQKVERAVLNLLSNAMKFTPKGGKIVVRVEKTRTSALIKVADNGEGLEPELLGTVMDRFSQRSPLGDPRWGMGLGLPYVRCVAQLHGGTVILEGKPGEGTVVTMSLSLHRALPEQPAAAGYDYAGGFAHCLVELADALPSDVFDSVNVN